MSRKIFNLILIITVITSLVTGWVPAALEYNHYANVNPNLDSDTYVGDEFEDVSEELDDDLVIDHDVEEYMGSDQSSDEGEGDASVDPSHEDDSIEGEPSDNQNDEPVPDNVDENVDSGQLQNEDEGDESEDPSSGNENGVGEEPGDGQGNDPVADDDTDRQKPVENEEDQDNIPAEEPITEPINEEEPAANEDTTPPTIPSNLRYSDLTDTSVTLIWDASTDDVSVFG
ncbi:hypothetical protein PRECH8_26480 [Insulibacter thermoxylanivorax]|uniref:Fibronectin type-III domain-containing protein n=1 Tax=Insulibacter thermoxylanivorax TaxID=2749268 RepID=A0A916VGF3_9BACL|nr:hypothetical protein [Insulibacter thermoxylanivorax]GFR39352.1 hypothetical protein PRECH8_26480 [Insulibacter thermoxylanivorax]